MRLICAVCSAEVEVPDAAATGTTWPCPRCQEAIPLPPPWETLDLLPVAPNRARHAGRAAQAATQPVGGLGRTVPTVPTAPTARPPAATRTRPGPRAHPAPWAASCRHCGCALEPLVAPLGVCDDCREDLRREGLVAAASGPPAPSPRLQAPLAPDVELIAEALTDPGTGPDGAPDAPTLPDGVPVARLEAEETIQAPFRTPPRVSLWRVAAAVCGAVGVIAVVVLATRPEWLPGRQADPTSGPLPSLAEVWEGWKRAAGVIEGTPEDHLRRGIALALQDRAPSYRAAEEAFRKALLLDPGNLEAASRYVDVVALWRGDRLSADEEVFLNTLLGQVLKAQPGIPVARRARARLLLLSQEPELARAEAEVAVRTSPLSERAEAMLVWGQTYLKQSAAIAQEKLEAALEIDPSLRAAHFHLGLAAESAGRYARAATAFERRLALDPDHPEALGALVRVYLHLGELELARQAVARLQAFSQDPETRLQAAALARAQGRLSDAESILEETLERGALRPSERVKALCELSALAREQGRAEQAWARARAALAVDPDAPAAHFAALLAALLRKDPAAARVHLRACERALDDPARSHEYQGRILFASGDYAGAAAAFRKSIEQAPTRLGNYLAAAAALARSGDDHSAFALMRRALDLDPSSLAARRQPPGPFHEPAHEIARLAMGVFRRGGSTGWPDVYDAVVTYHLGERERASRAFDRILKRADPESLPALLYRAQIEVDRKRFDAALRFARRAAAAESQSPAARYLIGRALEGLGRMSEAREAYLAALQRNPRMASASVQLAALATREGRVQQAREELLRAVAVEPDNLVAQTALFRLGY